MGQSPVAGLASHAPPDDAQKGDRDGTKPFGRNPVSPDGFETAPGGLAGDDCGGVKVKKTIKFFIHATYRSSTKDL